MWKIIKSKYKYRFYHAPPQKNGTADLETFKVFWSRLEPTTSEWTPLQPLRTRRLPLRSQTAPRPIAAEKDVFCEVCGICSRGFSLAAGRTNPIEKIFVKLIFIGSFPLVRVKWNHNLVLSFLMYQPTNFVRQSPVRQLWKQSRIIACW